jgi:hypothetical protein
LESDVGIEDAAPSVAFPSVSYITKAVCYVEPPGTTSPLS